MLKKLSVILTMIPLLMFSVGFTYKETSVSLPVTVEGLPGEIVVEAEGESPKPKEGSITFIGQKNFEFSVNEPGDYYYKVYQKAGKEENAVYDDTEYEMLMSIRTENDTDLTYRFYFFSEKGKPDEIKFVNQKLVIPEDSSKPTDKPTEPTRGKDIQTGDNTGVTMYIAGFAVGGLLLGMCLYSKRKRKKERR